MGYMRYYRGMNIVTKVAVLFLGITLFASGQLSLARVHSSGHHRPGTAHSATSAMRSSRSARRARRNSNASMRKSLRHQAHSRRASGRRHRRHGQPRFETAAYTVPQGSGLYGGLWAGASLGWPDADYRADFDSNAYVPPARTVAAPVASAQPRRSAENVVRVIDLPRLDETARPIRPIYNAPVEALPARTTASLPLPSGVLPDIAPTTADPDEEEAVTLVFKDGRPSEQIHNFLLNSTTLFVLDQDHYEIPMEELDLVATEKVNRDAGIVFHVPATEQ